TAPSGEKTVEPFRQIELIPRALKTVSEYACNTQRASQHRPKSQGAFSLDRYNQKACRCKNVKHNPKTCGAPACTTAGRSVAGGDPAFGIAQEFPQAQQVDPPGLPAPPFDPLLVIRERSRSRSVRPRTSRRR